MLLELQQTAYNLDLRASANFKYSFKQPTERLPDKPINFAKTVTNGTSICRLTECKS